MSISIKPKNVEMGELDIRLRLALGLAFCAVTYQGKGASTGAVDPLDATCNALKSLGIEFDIIHTTDAEKAQVSR